MKISRLERLRQELDKREVDAILISHPENRFYLSGFSGSSGYLLITKEDAILATDFRYLEQAKKEAKGFELFQVSGGAEEWLGKLISQASPKRLGFESGHLTYHLYRQLSEVITKFRPRPKLTPLEGVVESLRAIKEPEELELISKAVKLSDAALEYLKDIIHTGISERELALKLELFLREQGSEKLPFEIIVASGPNSAMPHHKPSERRIELQEPIIIDIGARVGGYVSDTTRTIYLGKQDKRFSQIYDIVLGAQLGAISIISQGMKGSEADKIARAMIEEAGYASAFGHSLGHGIGLEAHEKPTLGPNSEEELKEGMVFTIEPGIYLSGWGGVRIEDVVVLREGRLEVITKAQK